MPSTVLDPHGSLPRTESELLLRRPPSHRDGVFPRKLLLPGERVLFETRPKTTWSGGWAVGAVAFFFVSSLAVGLLGLAGLVQPAVVQAGSATAAAGVGFAGALWWAAILALLVRSRGRTAFALTDRRVLSVEGFWGSDFRFAGWQQVVGLLLPKDPPDTVVFETASSPGMGPPGAAPGPRQQIRWRSIEWAPRTYEFAQTAFALVGATRAAAARELRQRNELLSTRVICEYCGNPVVVGAETAPAQRCPRCSAPLATSLAPPPSGPPTTASTPRAHIPVLRPVVYLGREAIDWFRAVPVLWAAVIVLLLLGTDLAPTTAGADSAPDQAVIGTFLVILPLTYILWAQALRKWATAVRTLRASLPIGSPWEVRVARPLGLRLWIAVGGYGTSILLVVGTIVAGAEYSASGAAAGIPTTGSEIALGGALLGAVGAIVLGQAALVTSYAEIATGSSIPSIERSFRRSRTLALASLLAGFWPFAVLLALVGLYPTSVPAYALVWFLPALAGPLGLMVSLTWIARTLDNWTDLADRVAGDVATEDPRFRSAFDRPGVTYSSRASVAVESGTAAYAPREFLARRRGTAYGLGVAAGSVVIVLVLISAGWLGPALAGIPPVRPTSAPLPPAPRVLVAGGTVWDLAPYHYRSDGFGLNRSAMVSGSFNATGTVQAFVMDYNGYNVWLGFGTLGYGYYSTGNVTAGQIEDPIGSAGWYYVVLVNYNTTSWVNVTWSSPFVATYP